MEHATRTRDVKIAYRIVVGLSGGDKTLSMDVNVEICLMSYKS